MNTRDRRVGGFTLIELLVVIGIIGVLISILLPSMNAARNSARNVRIKAQLNAVKQALEAFKNDVGEYPDSAKKLDPADDSSYSPPPNEEDFPRHDTTLYGAQALVRGLLGLDLKGYVTAKRARDYNRQYDPPWWYDQRDDSSADCPLPVPYESPLPRETKLFNEAHSIVRTASPCPEETPKGSRPNSITEFNEQFLMIDAFDIPVLYYKANPRGTVMCDDQASGGSFADAFAGYDPEYIPFYNLLDNDVFTGSVGANSSGEPGWGFGVGLHDLQHLGEPLPPPGELHDPTYIPAGASTTFTLYIHDHKSEQAAAGAVRPVNPDTYLLISAGRDGIYGTADDINNFQER